MLNLDRNTDPWFIDWLNVRVFLQVALIYLCLHVITVAGCFGLSLIEVNPIKCEHPFKRLHAPGATSGFRIGCASTVPITCRAQW
jgi:hypothetical protein